MPISVNDAYREIVGFMPNPMQEAIFERIASGDCAVLLKAPTGSGKTEAVLVPALTGLLDGDSPRRLFLILPTRSLVDDQVQRVEKTLAQFSRQVNRELALVVDTGGQSYRETWKNGNSNGKHHRHLYDGDVILTTLDKFLYRFFSFGEPFKNYIFPLRIHYGAKRPLFCFDEAHTYENVAFTNFVNLVYTLAIEKGHDVVVMTATLPESYAGHLRFLETVDFVDDPANSQTLGNFYQRPHEGKMLKYVPANEEDLVNVLVEQAKKHYQPSRRVIVTAELVKDAVKVYEQLRQQFGEDALLYHGRIPDKVDEHPDKGRTNIYAELKRRDSANEGYLLVTTSAIEVGCDLNAHTLVTELCNPDQLIQRAGRCNRKGEIPDARVIVIGNKIKEFLSDLDEKAQDVYLETLKNMSEKLLDRQAILEHLRVIPQMDYRVQMMFDMLYEYVYEANQVYKGLHEKGLVITRSWEPSLTVCTGFDESGHPLNPISINFRSLIAWIERGDTIAPDCLLYRRRYEGDVSHHYRLEPVTGGYYCAYFLDLYLQIPENYFDPITGYKELPKAFQKQYAGAYRERVTFESKPSILAAEQTPVKKKKKSEGSSESDKKAPSFWYLRELEIAQEAENEEENTEDNASDE
ncbi:MAG: CRISPR-associated helicase Cas3' [Anaerolineales bacterium]